MNLQEVPPKTWKQEGDTWANVSVTASCSGCDFSAGLVKSYIVESKDLSADLTVSKNFAVDSAKEQLNRAHTQQRAWCHKGLRFEVTI